MITLSHSGLPDGRGSARRAGGLGVGLFSLLLAVVVLAGCASAPTTEANYNPITGYPAVGDHPWHL